MAAARFQRRVIARSDGTRGRAARPVSFPDGVSQDALRRARTNKDRNGVIERTIRGGTPAGPAA